MPAAAPSNGSTASTAAGPKIDPGEVTERYWQATRHAARLSAKIKNSSLSGSSAHIRELRAELQNMNEIVASLEEYARAHNFWEFVVQSKPRTATVRPAGPSKTVPSSMRTVASAKMPSGLATPKSWDKAAGPGKVSTTMDDNGVTRVLDQNPPYSSFVGHESTHLTNMDRHNFRTNPHKPGLRRAISRHGSFATAVALETLFGGLARDALAGEFLFDPLGWVDRVSGLFRRSPSPDFLREDMH